MTNFEHVFFLPLYIRLHLQLLSVYKIIVAILLERVALYIWYIGKSATGVLPTAIYLMYIYAIMDKIVFKRLQWKAHLIQMDKEEFVRKLYKDNIYG